MSDAAPGGKRDDQSPSPTPVGPLGVLASVFRAWFGVQSEARRQRDFGSGNPRPFIIAGVIFVIVMVIAVITAVNLAITASS